MMYRNWTGAALYCFIHIIYSAIKNFTMSKTALFYILYDMHYRSVNGPDSCHSDWCPAWSDIGAQFYCTYDETNGKW